MNTESSLGLGTAAIGRPQYINVRQERLVHHDLKAFKQHGFNVLEQAYQLGIRYFDTAPGYGLAENLLLEWLQTKNDQEIQVATKWGYTYVANFDAKAKIHEIKEHSLSKLNEQWETSKAFKSNLKVYQIHSATLETGVLTNEAVLNKLAFLKHEHQIKIGITTTGSNQVEVIKEALDVSVNNEVLFDAFQVTYNILDQSFKSISKELISRGKKIIIKEALANGRLFPNENYRHYQALYNYLKELAKKYDVGIDAIALKFCALTIPDSIVLSGASQINHLKANLQVNMFKLNQEEIKNLKSFNTHTTKYWQERKQLTWN